MADIAVDAPAATAVLDHGRGQVEDVAATVKAQAPQSSDPRVADLLRILSERTGGDAHRAGEHAAAGSDAAKGLKSADEQSAAAATGVPVGASPSSPPPASAVASAPAQVVAAQQQAQQAQQVAAGQQMAQQAQQQMAQQAQQQMMAAATQQGQVAAAGRQAANIMSAVASPVASATAGMPAGTILVDQSSLVSLIDKVAGGGGGAGGSSVGSSGGSSWNGSTSPEPLDVNDVQYEKTHGVLSKEQISSVIGSALDKTGIEDPQARAKWETVLEHMANEESSNNASSVNNSDSNAVGAIQVDGSPAQSSRGTWQTIPTTFAAYHAAGTSSNIYDPESSAGAAINYMQDRYHIGKDGSGLDDFLAARAPGRYVGY